MKRIYLYSTILIISLISFKLIGQNEMSIVPPSPSAQSFHKHGNTNVSLYTGTANIVIPIYTIKTKNFTIPITLRYSDANGVRVNEYASWVGLGWTLNAGGSVTRTIKDLPDDHHEVGYYFKPYPIRLHPLYDDLEAMYNNQWDGDPDVFRYNFNGISGTFFIKKEIEGGKILQKPLSNNIITANFSTSPMETCRLLGFDITDQQGNTYSFEEKESEQALTLFGEPLNIPPLEEIKTGWHLKRMSNSNNSEDIIFSYKVLSPMTYYEYVPYVSGIGTTNEKIRSRKIIALPRIETINFTGGSIDFISEDELLVRKDKQDTYLKKILVKNTTGSIIKEFTFHYSYFTESGTVPFENNYTGVNNSNLRLKLDSIKETEKPAYVFTYNENIYLPDRHSYAIDHWGYYNGKTSNQGLIHNFRIDFAQTPHTDPEEQLYQIIERGTANRFPNSEFSDALIIKEIEYPTGGKTIFEYEGNQARIENNEFFPDFIYPKETIDFLDSEPQSINVISSSIARIDVIGGGQEQGSCQKKVVFSKGTEEYSAFLNIENEYEDFVLLPEGTYTVTWYYLYPDGTCTEDRPDVFISWNNENISSIKNVGGIRIKSIKEISNNEEYTTFFYYSDNDGLPSGQVTSIPFYGHFIMQGDLLHGNHFVTSCYPDIHSPTPLTYTDGNVVGYKKITKKKISGNLELGKTEYIYSTAEDYPDIAGASLPWIRPNYNLPIPEEYANCYWNDFYVKPWPFEQADTHDTQRGLLLKRTDFISGDNTYDTLKIYETEYHTWEYGQQTKNIPIIYEDVIVGHVLGGVDGQSGFDHRYFHDYKLYSDYTIKKKGKITDFYGTEKVVQETTYEYDIYDENGENPLYSPIQITTISSEGTETTQNFVYPRDYELLTGLTSSEETAYDELFTRNVYTPIQTSVEKSGNLITKNRTNYHIFSEGLLPKSEEKAFGNESLKEELFYDKYDIKGNIQQIHTIDDITTTVLYGYDYAYPIAKIENASYNEVLAELGVTYEDLQSKTSPELAIIFNTLRNSLAFKDALITNYTYIPLTGMNKQTDPNGKTTSYEYDDFNRLKLIKDQDGNIIKTFEYNYKQD